MPQQKRPISIDDLFKLKLISSVTMSPGGDRLVYAVKRSDQMANKNYSNLYTTATAPKSYPRMLTSGDYNDQAPQYSPDGEWVAFISDRDKSSALWVMPMAGGDPVRLTSIDDEVAAFCWSPDSARLAYSARKLSAREKLIRDGKEKDLEKAPKFRHITRLHHKEDGEGFWQGTWYHIHLVGVDGKKGRTLTKDERDHMEPAWSPDGKRIACTANMQPDPDMYPDNLDVLMLTPGGSKSVKFSTTRGPKNGLSWSSDSGQLAWIGHTGAAGEYFMHNLHVWVQSVSGGKARNITKNIDHNCLNLVIADTACTTFAGEPVLWSPDGKQVFFPVSEQGTSHLYSKPVRGGKAQLVIGGDCMVFGLTRMANSGLAACLIGTAVNPTDILLLEPENANVKQRRITHINYHALKSVHLSVPEQRTVKVGRKTVEGWLLKPPGFRKNRKYPLILQIHGGPHCQYGYAFFHEMQWLAAQGYVVLYANPTGGTGYGIEYQRDLHARWGIPDYKELMGLIDQVEQEPWIDKNRLYVTGGSYGGYMTNVIVSKTQRFRAAVTQRSVVNMDSMFGSSDWGYEIGWEVGGTPWTHRDLFLKLSPLTQAHRVQTPLLIIHSDNDLRCPIGQADELFTKLKYLGKEVEYLVFEGESHGLSRGGRPQNRAERLRQLLAWFEDHK
jgi:dipeptidyl aminopeptidase/acylaminoacyl peptidase